MSRELEITAIDEYTVKVKIASEAERDLSVEHDGVDLIQKVATALHLSVSISTLKGDLDVPPES